MRQDYPVITTPFTCLLTIMETNQRDTEKCTGSKFGASTHTKTYKILPFDSLLYQVDVATKTFSEHAICAAIIKAIAPGSNLRSYLESTPDLSLEEVMEFLKSHFQEKGSSAYFTDLQNAAQDNEETVMEYLLRLMCLRRKILLLSKQEGCPYSEGMLSRHFFNKMFIGIRNENVRVELRERCGGDHSMSDNQLLKHAADVVANETERKTKLAKKGGVGVNSVEKSASVAKKENPFIKIEELKMEREKDMSFVRAELAEIKNIIKDGNGNLARNTNPVPPLMPGQYPAAQYQGKTAFQVPQQLQYQGVPQQQNGGGRSRRFRKCADCHANNRYRCSHCFGCGAAEHEFVDCPNKQKN